MERKKRDVERDGERDEREGGKRDLERYQRRGKVKMFWKVR